MRGLIGAIVIWLAAVSPLTAQDSGSGVQGTISSQIEAFQADDLDAAFAFASPAIRQYFGSSQNFGLMVQRGFPMVWRPADFQFLNLRQDAGQFVQRVLVTDQGGVKHVLEYRLSSTAKGWQINSVIILPSQDASV